LKTTNSANPWPRLIHAIDVLTNVPTNQLRTRVEEVLAVDRWLWFLAVENVFTDDDSYWNKGADYEIYYEPETGRLHPIEHDGNEAFMTVDTQLSPMHQIGNTNRPVISRLLGVPELKQRYLAHMRVILQEWFNPSVLNPLIDQHRDLILADLAADTQEGLYDADLLQRPRRGQDVHPAAQCLASDQRGIATPSAADSIGFRACAASA
jgi:hypothetical protein